MRPIDYRAFCRYIESKGCRYIRTKGSHMIFKREGLKRPLVIPKDKEISTKVIRTNLQTLEISTKQYEEEIKNF